LFIGVLKELVLDAVGISTASAALQEAPTA
jgi:hypothetical protein